MGNKVAHPAPSYEEACGYFTAEEINGLRYKFESWCKGNSKELTLNDFMREVKNQQSVYQRVMPRLFEVLDIKRDKHIDFEEYFCTVALLYKGSFEDKVKWLFLMYCPSKSSHLQREHLTQFLLDSMILTSAEKHHDTYHNMIKDAMPLVDSMVDLIIAQVRGDSNG